MTADSEQMVQDGVAGRHTPAITWKGDVWDSSKGPAAHPNLTLPMPAQQSPDVSPRWNGTALYFGVYFGGQRSRLTPLN